MNDEATTVMDAPAMDAPSKDDFLNQLQALDNGEPEEKVFVKPDAKATDTKAETKVEPKPEAKVEKEDEPTAEADKSQSKGEAKKPDDQQKAPSKWAKNEERKAKTWEQINAERQQIAAEKEALAKAKAELESAKKTPVDQPYRDEHGNTVKDVRDAVKALRGKGDAASYKTADELEAYAEHLAQKEGQYRQEQHVKSLQDGWAKNYSALSEKHPDLKKQDSELYKATVAVIHEFPYLTQRADGINAAVKAAQLQLDAANVENTRAENAKLKAELEKLQKKLSLAGGPPTSPNTKAKSSDDMDHKELGEFLRKQAAEGDAERGFGSIY
jgi:chromosome segregation ATPase